MSYSLASADLSKYSETNGTNNVAMAVEIFYVWYLNELELDRDPLNNESGSMEKFVSLERLQSLADQIRLEGGLDVDYFLQAQDYLDDWASNVDASLLGDPSKDKSVKVSVTMGNTESTRWRLIVTMVLSGDGWKLDEVAQAP